MMMIMMYSQCLKSSDCPSDNPVCLQETKTCGKVGTICHCFYLDSILKFYHTNCFCIEIILLLVNLICSASQALTVQTSCPFVTSLMLSVYNAWNQQIASEAIQYAW